MYPCKHENMFTCMHISMCTCTHAYMSLCIYVCMYMRILLYVSENVHVHVYVYVFVYVYVCVYVMCIYVHACIYIYIYIYIYIEREWVHLCIYICICVSEPVSLSLSLCMYAQRYICKMPSLITRLRFSKARVPRSQPKEGWPATRRCVGRQPRRTGRNLFRWLVCGWVVSCQSQNPLGLQVAQSRSFFLIFQAPK